MSHGRVSLRERGWCVFNGARGCWRCSDIRLRLVPAGLCAGGKRKGTLSSELLLSCLDHPNPWASLWCCSGERGRLVI